MIYVEQVDYSDAMKLRLKLSCPDVEIERDEFFKECCIKFDNSFMVSVRDSESNKVTRYRLSELQDMNGEQLYVPNLIYEKSEHGNGGIAYIADMDTLSLRLEFCTFYNKSNISKDIQGYCTMFSFSNSKYIGYNGKPMVYYQDDGNKMNKLIGLSSDGYSALILSYVYPYNKIVAISLYHRGNLVEKIDLDGCFSPKDILSRQDVLELVDKMRSYHVLHKETR